MKTLDNKWDWLTSLWFPRVKEHYIIDFSIEYNDSFNEADRKCVEGPRKRMLEEIMLWIKMLFLEKGMMWMETDKMDG